MNINDLYDLEAGKIKLTAVALATPIFREIYESIKDKSIAIKEIEYIIWVNHWKSPYNQILDTDKRAEIVKQDLFGDKNYEVSDVTLRNEKRYVDEFQTSEILQMLKAARIGIAYCIEGFHKLKENKTVSEETVYKWLERIGNSAKSLDVLEKAAKADALQAGKVRGGAEIGVFELPRK